MADGRMMKLGFILHGVGRTWGDWRHPDMDLTASTSFAVYTRQTQLCERGKFDFVFVADSLSITEKVSPHLLSRFEPVTILSALAAVTSHIGLVGTLSVTYSEPFNVARQLASLDHISGGRVGWNVVTSWLADSAANFSKPNHPVSEIRYRMAAEYLDVVQGLWDSWEDDAFLHDKAAGIFADTSKLHRLDHHGEFFQVRGPLNIKRSRQGQPVIFQAGASEDGRNFAARRAEAIFSGGATSSVEALQAYYSDVKARATGFGRDADRIQVLPEMSPVIGRTEQEAEANFQQLVALGSLESGLGALSRTFSDHDFTHYDLDGRFPDMTNVVWNSTAERLYASARNEGLSIRQIAQRLATPRGEFVGTPQQVADRMQAWFESRAADGFMLFETLPGQLDLFVELVVPILQARGLFRKDYEGATFRENLGLAFPVNRHAAARETAP
jgi:FMN-dependent oxidoreductase (nitrilotriacetate monooxygenase family)